MELAPDEFSDSSVWARTDVSNAILSVWTAAEIESPLPSASAKHVRVKDKA